MNEEEHTEPEFSHATNDYLANLKTINKIRFTGREIDIIACMIGGRSYKKISSFLSISPKTVEMHVRNIMLRLGCNSRDNIIDFLEKSDKFALVKKHYSNLLIKATFELELKKIPSLTKDYSINCLIFYCKQQKTRDLLISDLEKHLNIAGFNTCSKIWARGKAEQFLLDKLGLQSVNHIIYVITDECLEQLNKNEFQLTEEASSLITMLKQPASNVIFLFLTNENFLSTNEKLANFTCIDLKEHENYYLVVFELIKKLLPTVDIDKNINNFHKKQTIFLQHSHDRIWLREDGISAKLPINYFKRSKLLNIAIAIIFLLIIKFGYMIFDNAKHISVREYSLFAEHDYNDEITNKKILQKVFNLPSRNTKFTGRKVALQQITEQLGKSNFGIITQAISGLGGVGKTQLATEFAYQAAEKKTYDAIFWVAAGTDVVLANSYKELAKQLQIDVKGLKSSEMQILMHQEFANKYNNKKILFVLDNVPSCDQIQEYLVRLRKQWPIGCLLHILITTRSQYWAETPLILDIFTEKEAIAFVKKHLPNEENVAATKLAETLNYFPLALSQAVAYIKEHTNIDDYLKLYEQQKHQLLDRIAEEDNQYKTSLWKTWNIALAKLTNNALNILFISSYLEPDEIPIDFFTNLTIEERVDAIKELRKHSFIILKNHNKTFRIHRLLQDVIRLSINNTKENHHNKVFGKIITNNSNTEHVWLNQAISLLEDKFDFDYMQNGKWSAWNSNLPHARIIAEHAIMVTEQTFTRGLELYCKVAMFMTYINSSPEAFGMWLKIKDLLVQQNKKTPSLIIAKIYYNLGVAMLYKNPNEASEYLQQAISVAQNDDSQISEETWDFLSILGIKSFYTKEAVLNYKNIFLANTFTTVGNTERELGNFNAAITNYNKAIAMLKNCADNDRTQYYYITALDHLGDVYTRVGNLIQAEDILQELKKEVDRKFKNHIEQAFIYKHLAKLKYIMGDLDKAKELFRIVAQIEGMVHSTQHRAMGEVCNELARVELANNNIHKAKAKLVKAEEIYKRYYDNDNIHPYVPLYLNFYRVYEYLGEYDKALEYITRTLAIANAHYKEYLYSAMAFQITIAEKWPQLSTKTNIDYWQQALAIVIKLFGKKHYQVARYHYLLGQALELKGDTKKAQIQYEAALKILRKQTINHSNLTKFHNKHIQLIQTRLLKNIR